MERMAKGIQSVEIAAHILDVVVEAPRPLRLKDVAQMAGLAPNKVRMYLVSLIRVGLIEQNEEHGLYAVGRKALHLGILALGQEGLLNLARQAALKLGDDIGDAVLLSVWDRDRSVIIAHSENGALPMTFRVGKTTPLDTATGTVFSAYLAEALAAGREKLQREWLAGLPDAIAAVHARGFAMASQLTLHEGVTLSGYGAVAAPIFGRDGRLAYVLTALFATGLTPEERDVRVGALVAAAKGVSSAAGAT
ncbi:MAG TPA: helix-turn-helix domain-containing protein [Sphingomonas sp.]|nr:helix-turn-helix domain-containing protein [Sphingomonas sp.]